MNKNYNLPETAVFIDGDWLHHAARRLKKEIDYAKLWVMLNNSFAPHPLIHFYGTIAPQHKKQIHFLDAIKSAGYIIKLGSLKIKKDRVITTNLDVVITVDVLSLPNEIKNIVLITGDSDFLPLVKQIKKNKKSLVLITVPIIAHSLIKAAENQFINLDKLLSNLSIGKKIPKIKGRETNLIPPKDWHYIEQGEHYSSYLTIRKLFTSATKEIIIVDPYIDDQILHMLRLVSTNITIHIITDKVSPVDFCIQVKKMRNEGYIINIHKTKTFHDRFLGIDGKLWHSGHSFKDLGSKDSLLNRITENDAYAKIKKRIDNEINNAKEYCI